MLTTLIILVISIFLQLMITIRLGDMASDALDYATVRNTVLVGALVMLICIVFRFAIDRIQIKNRWKLPLHPFVYDIIAYIISTLLLVGILEMYAAEIIPVGIAVALMSLVLVFLNEKDVYLYYAGGVDEEEDDDPYGLGDDDDPQDNKPHDDEGGVKEKPKSEYEKTLDELNNMIREATDEIKHPHAMSEAAETGDEFTQIEKETEAGKENNKEENIEKNKAKKFGKGKRKKGGIDVGVKESDVDDVDGNIDDVIDDGIDDDIEDGELCEDDMETPGGIMSNPRTRGIVIQLLRALAFDSVVVLGAFAMSNIYIKNYSGLYYMIMALLAALTIILRMITRTLRQISEEEECRRMSLLGYGLIAIFVTLFLCKHSILIGLIYLLGAFLSAFIIPMIFNYWGTGGHLAIHRNTLVISRMVTRILALIIILLAVWFLSYGAISETDFLIIISVALSTTFTSIE